jgi:hypothetical protein
MNTKSTHHRDAIDKVADAVDNALVACVHRMDADDEPDLDGILMSLGEARAYIVQAKLQAHLADRMDDVIKIDIPNDQPRVYADELPATHELDVSTGKQKRLPKLKPQGHDKVKYKPGVTKLMKGADKFICPTCGAIPDTNCFKFSGPGKNAELTDERNDGSFYHAKRQDLAKAYNDRIRKANILH